MSYKNNRRTKARFGAYSEYWENKKMYSATTFRINPNGEGVYLMDGKEIPEEEFKRMFPIGLIDRSQYGKRLDSRQRIF
jgi:hypothetical protein